ncbi:hypothetical protein PMAYCL1PPCAC_24149 [Pristionchus mayeri]|uniref:Uncharacterized protein n=1 Tax=Pristionchus mayeri TaxID=1317129 RepID=A0AAN5I741_9BILA|nr:hypothetical protein PMAYCL1PPCAC_24149 [Pristionchus mayeri]
MEDSSSSVPEGKQVACSRYRSRQSYPFHSNKKKQDQGICVDEYLIITYESENVKVIKTDDIIKNPLFTFLPLGKAKLRIENFYPCWEYPFFSPITRLTGLNDGVPTIIKLENGSWNVTEIVKQRTAIYSEVKCKVSSMGQTVAVFYNLNHICICLFDKEIRWREDRLSCKIRECFISETFVSIRTDLKILIVDVRGLLSDERKYSFVCTSVDADRLLPNGDEQEIIVSMFVSCRTEETPEGGAFLYFKNGTTRSVVLSEQPLSRESSLQEVHDRKDSLNFSMMTNTLSNKIIDVISIPEGIFELTDDGYLNRKCGEHTIWSNNLMDYSSVANFMKFITIEGNEPNHQMTFVLARCNDFLYLKEVATMEDASYVPIPFKQFGDNAVFGHFDGPPDHGRCILYTNSHRNPSELVRVEIRANHARRRESLIPSCSLFQQDTVVRLIPHKNKWCKPVISVVSTAGTQMELQELSRTGKMKLKKEIEMRTESQSPIFIASFDTYYVHSTNQLYIVGGSTTSNGKVNGELSMVTWDSNSNSHSCQVSYLDSFSIREVFYFGREHATNPPFIHRLSR